ncbi:MAG TPA: efflux RND transporter periplasmic adaptor subunit [Gammaproteobacteria bacterium]
MDNEASIPPAAAPAARPRAARRWVGGGALAVVLAAFAYLTHDQDRQASPAAQPAAAPVRVATASRRDVAVVERTIGTVLANTTVQVTARVSGVVDSAYFREGQVVEAGDLLFQIDPRPYEGALAQVRADLAKDQAQLTNAVNNEKRTRSVFDQHLTSAEQLDAAIAATAGAQAAVQADEAAVRLAQLNLDYTRIRSPIDGKTGAILVQPGNLVSANGTSPLVTITQIQPIRVSFALPQSDLPQIQARAAAGDLVATVEPRGAGTEGADAGDTALVDFVNNAVDDTTGTIELRATFANADASLVPGQLVDVAVALDRLPLATVVPRAAVNDGPDGQFAYVVTAGRRAEQRSVRVLFDDGADAAIDGDVRPGELVIVEGQLRVVPGAAVSYDETQLTQSAAATADGRGA